MIIKIICIIISFLIVISKFLDCYSTVKGLKNSNNTERNPIALFLMNRFGTTNTIWGIFVFTVLITGASLYYIFTSNDIIFDIGFIIIGSIVAFTQFAVAKTNFNGEYNFFTKIVDNIYNNFKRKDNK